MTTITVKSLQNRAEAKPAYPPAEPNPLIDIFMQRFAAEFKQRKQSSLKQDRAEKVAELKSKIVAEFLPEEKEPKYTKSQVEGAWSHLQEKVIRQMILDGVRIDGRSNKQIRPIACEVGILPRTHGTGLFQRGETQALVVATLGTVSDEQRVDGLGEEYSKKFMLDYNFPPFSVGECRPIRGPGARDWPRGAGRTQPESCHS